MNSQKRRGAGRPNRGGGRQNRRGGGNAPPAPVGLSGGRKGGGRVDYDDDFAVAPERNGEEVNEEKKRERRKVEMQVLHMSDKSKSVIRDALFRLHGSSYELKTSKDYHDQGRRMDKRFWVQDRQLLVRGGFDFSDSVEAEEEKSNVSVEKVNKFALKKLENFGFHASRCVKALEKSDGDLGMALESLMVDCFEVVPNPTDVSEDERKDFKERMEDEKMALESIYADRFVERITDKVWAIKLELPHLLKYLPRSQDSKPGRAYDPSKDKKVCQFYLNGYCRFGIRCRLKHVQPEKYQVVDDRHLKPEEEDKSFTLEIRFPENHLYPRDPPLVCFSTELSKFSKSLCLKITSRLMAEAKAMAVDGSPSVFALVNIVESEADMDQVVRTADCAFTFADDHQSLERNGEKSTDKLLGAIQKSDGKRNGRNEESDKAGKTALKKEDKLKDLARILEENLSIKKRMSKRTVDEQMMKHRQGLPAWKEKDRILEKLESSQVIVISGMTGCGKSTQVPQFIIDDWLQSSSKKHCSLICTQPRRISAIGVAERVAQERNERAGNLIGYQIRLESRTSSSTRLLFCTTGILLRRLESDPNLSSVTHVVVDEVHERSEESDFLLMILRDLLPKRKDLRIILMSATFNASMFSDYFGGVPIIEIPGRTFPVEQMFLEEVLERTRYAVEEGSTYARPTRRDRSEKTFDLDPGDVDVDLSGDDFKPPRDNQRDEQLNAKQIFHRYNYCPQQVCKTLSVMDFEKINYDLVESTLVYIAEGRKHDMPKEGSILVFLPGMQEIMTLYEQISHHPLLGSKAGKFKLIPLHSSLSPEEQQSVFKKPPPGVRKIVISTNLAETSITIDDCVFVVEVGRMKEKRFDPMKNMESLDTVWVSRANALQRKGRAGRVMAGYCFHLYTQFRFDVHLRQDPVPEIQRVPLEQMVLRIKILPLFTGWNVQAVLRKMPEAPSMDGITTALDRLKGVGAIDAQDELTPLGYHLASLPVDVRIGKLLLFGAVFRCLDAALTIAASLSYRSPFISPFGKREEAKKKKLEYAARNSDHLTIWNAYCGWFKACQASQYAGFNYAQEHFLHHKTLQMLVSMKHQFAELLSSIGFIPQGVTLRQLDKHSRNGADAIQTVTGQDLNANNGNHKIIVSVLCASLYPNVVQILRPEVKYKQTATGAMYKAPTAEDLKFKTKEDGYVAVHPSSVNFSVGEYESPYLVYHEKIKTSRVFIRELSMVPIYPMILFGGTGVQVELHRGQFVISMESGWIKVVTANHEVAELLKELRFELDELLTEKIQDPSLDLVQYPRGKLIIDTISNVISKE